MAKTDTLVHPAHNVNDTAATLLPLNDQSPQQPQHPVLHCRRIVPDNIRQNKHYNDVL